MGPRQFHSPNFGCNSETGTKSDAELAIPRLSDTRSVTVDGDGIGIPLGAVVGSVVGALIVAVAAVTVLVVRRR